MSERFRIVPVWINGYPRFLVAEKINHTSYFEYHRDENNFGETLEFNSVNEAKTYIDQFLATEQKKRDHLNSPIITYP